MLNAISDNTFNKMRQFFIKFSTPMDMVMEV